MVARTGADRGLNTTETTIHHHERTFAYSCSHHMTRVRPRYGRRLDECGMQYLEQHLEEYLTTAEVARWVKCTEWFVRSEYRSGRLNAHHLGRHLRFTADDVRTWLGQDDTVSA